MVILISFWKSQSHKSSRHEWSRSFIRCRNVFALIGEKWKRSRRSKNQVHEAEPVWHFLIVATNWATCDFFKVATKWATCDTCKIMFMCNHTKSDFWRRKVGNSDWRLFVLTAWETVHLFQTFSKPVVRLSLHSHERNNISGFLFPEIRKRVNKAQACYLKYARLQSNMDLVFKQFHELAKYIIWKF